MQKAYESLLYKRVHAELCAIKLIDCHEHLQRESELPEGKDIHIGRFFAHYASSDLVSAGMPIPDMSRVQNDPGLTPKERWALLAPWYKKSYNTAYCEAIRIAVRDLYGIEDLSEETVDRLTEKMRAEIHPGFTRKVFDLANIDYAMNNPFGPKVVFNPDFSSECFICDMTDSFTELEIQKLAGESGIDILCLDHYLQVIDRYFEKYAAFAGAFKVGRAYDRILFWEDVDKGRADRAFNRLLSLNDRPDRREIKELEDYIMHYLCRKCGEYGLRMKFHTGIQEGYGNMLANSRVTHMNNLFMKYPQTGFDIYHISYPYQEELAALAKNFANVTVDFCWMWVISPAAGRRALSDMLDTVPANKIHGFGGDYIFVEGSYAHAVMARREIARVLCEKIEEGRFTEEYALEAGRMLLRDNAIENFTLDKRRKAFEEMGGLFLWMQERI